MTSTDQAQPLAQSHAGPDLQGPGDNTSADDPYIMYTGRTYNAELIAGMIRAEQGTKTKLTAAVHKEAFRWSSFSRQIVKSTCHLFSQAQP